MIGDENLNIFNDDSIRLRDGSKRNVARAKTPKVAILVDIASEEVVIKINRIDRASTKIDSRYVLETWCQKNLLEDASDDCLLYFWNSSIKESSFDKIFISFIPPIASCAF